MGRFGKKTKPQKQREPVIVEPNRRSLLDVLETNFSLAKRIIYVHRYIYVGELDDNFAKMSKIEAGTTVADIMKSDVNKINSGFTFEKLSGVLLYYDKFFCHMVEGSESTINMHLCSINTRYADCWKNIKLLAVVHHIQARFTNDWISYYGRPPIRVEAVDPQSDLESSMRFARNCCKKFYQFASTYVDDYNRTLRELRLRQMDDDEPIELDFSTITPVYPAPSDNRLVSAPSNMLGTKSENFLRMPSQSTHVIADPYRKDLPEVLLLDFLVNSKYMLDLYIFARLYGHIAETDNYEDRIWPHPCDFIPYNVFDKPYDPITDLPVKADELSTLDENKEDEFEVDALT